MKTRTYKPVGKSKELLIAERKESEKKDLEARIAKAKLEDSEESEQDIVDEVVEEVIE